MARTCTPAPSTKTRTVAYLRVSTDKQACEGVSLEAQRAKVEQYAALYDLDLVAVEVDAGESACTLKRPGLTRALAMLKSRKADALLVVKLDRLTRSVRDLGELLAVYFGPGKPAALLSVGDQIDTRTAAGRMVLNLLTTVAQWEREAIGERTAAALAHKAARGERVGEIPYGFALAADGVHLVEHGGEQLVIAAVRELRAAGLSLRAIVAQLDKRGLVARTGKALGLTQVARICAEVAA
jgi:DNA invertase Pin-like site-specific DNA recombinase